MTMSPSRPRFASSAAITNGSTAPVRYTRSSFSPKNTDQVAQAPTQPELEDLRLEVLPIQQGEYTMVLSHMTPEQLMSHTEVIPFEAAGDAGVQRPRKAEWVKKLTASEVQDLKQGTALYPDTLMLTISEEDTSRVTINVDGLHIPGDIKLHVTDGQHRIEAFRNVFTHELNKTKDEAWKSTVGEFMTDFPIPVIIGIGWDQDIERRTFVRSNADILPAGGSHITAVRGALGYSDPKLNTAHQTAMWIAHEADNGQNPFAEMVNMSNRADKSRPLSFKNLYQVLVKHFPDTDSTHQYSEFMALYNPLAAAFADPKTGLLPPRYYTTVIFNSFAQLRDLLVQDGVPAKLAKACDEDGLDTLVSKGMGTGGTSQVVARIRELLKD